MRIVRWTTAAVVCSIEAACSGGKSPPPATGPRIGGSNSSGVPSPCTSLAINDPASTASAALLAKLVKLNISWSNGSSQAGGLCSGSLITPSVVITAAHCTRNYESDPPYTPQANTTFMVGAGLSQQVAIYSATEGVGWHESGATDLGLYRLKTPVTLPSGVTPFALPTGCLETYPSFTIAGRMRNSQDSAPADFLLSPEESSASVGPDPHARGTYIQDSHGVLNPGDSGGAWFDAQNQLIAVTSAGTSGGSGDSGTRLCDVLPEIMTVLQTWGETSHLVGATSGAAAQSQKIDATHAPTASATIGTSVGTPVLAPAAAQSSAGADPTSATCGFTTQRGPSAR